MPDEGKLAPLRRSCWVPIVEDCGADAACSRFGGAPLLADGDEWPRCPNCEEELQLFLQLRAEDLPQSYEAPWSVGVVQLLYCTNTEPLCEVDCDAFFPFSPTTVARIVGGPFRTREASGRLRARSFPAKRIVDWQRHEDLPSAAELEETCRDHCLSEEDVESLIQNGFPVIGDKLGGWPDWVQGVEYPRCPECNSEMSLLFQLGSEDNLPYMFGDMGTGHVTYCRKHPRLLAFGWACS